MTAVLTKTGLNTKAAKYLYQVIDTETKEVLVSRKSNREYVAASVDGRFFFGRVDLIGKGDSKHNTKPIAYLVGYLNI